MYDVTEAAQMQIDNDNRKKSKNGATKLTHINFAGYVGPVTIFS